MICPKCGCTHEPEWRWEYIQEDEAYRIPTCPRCGEEMEESEACPLCGETMVKGKPFCFNCFIGLQNKLEWAAAEIAVKGTPRAVLWGAIYDMAAYMDNRFYEERRAKNAKTSDGQH